MPCTTSWQPLKMHETLLALIAGSKLGSAVCTAPSSNERAQVAMQALSIVVWVVELDRFRRRRCTQIVNVNVPQAVHFGAKTTKHRVVGMAGVARYGRARDGFERARQGYGRYRRPADSFHTAPFRGKRGKTSSPWSAQCDTTCPCPGRPAAEGTAGRTRRFFPSRL